MQKPDCDPIILSAVRTPMGKFQGSLAGIPAPQLGAVVIRAAVERAGIPDPAKIDEVIMGVVVSAGTGQAPARQSAIFGGIPASVPALTLNKVCGSSLKAIMLASQAVRAEEGNLFVAGGMESMSRAPFLVDGRTGDLRFGHAKLIDALLMDGLWDPFENWSMGDAAEFIADHYSISRSEMDEYACTSHQKAIAAIDMGKFKAEISAVEIPGKKGQIQFFDTDETPRRDTCMEILSGLKTTFKTGGTVTAGNAPGLNDGASAVVVASRSYCEMNDLKPLARVVGSAQFALEPRFLFDAPAFAIPRLLEKIGWHLSEVDLVELNEAFAAQVLANGKALSTSGWDWQKVNVNGGAIALGHPIGASGARILTTLVWALRDRGLKRGIAAMCLGGAESVALAVEIEG